MSYCLIHSDNTSLLELKELKDHDIYFEIPSDTGVDEYICELIEQEIVVEDPDALLIKYALDKEYLSFWGLRLAHHIRLHRHPDTLCKLPIIFVGEESIGELIKIADLYDILSTPGVYYVNEDLDKVQNLLKRIESGELKGLNDFNDYINKVRIPSPANYDTRHSMVNELTIYNWSNYIGCKNISDSVENRIQKQLYFKYKIAKEGSLERKVGNIDLPEFKRKSRVLLIDDDSEKGWDVFYKHLFSKSKGIEYYSLNIDSNQSRDKIIEKSIEQIKDIDPDVVLLDLRLSEEDTYESETEKLTGYKFLKEIKSLNRGIQVLILTASNKAWNMKSLFDVGGDGYYVKESQKSLIELIENFENSLEIASYLKEVDLIHSRIKSDISRRRFQVSYSFRNYLERTEKNLEIAFSLLEKAKTNPKYFNFAFLIYYQIFEDYVSLTEVYRWDRGNEYVFPKHGEPIQVIKNIRGENQKREWRLVYHDGGEKNPSYFSKIKNEDFVVSESNAHSFAKISFVLGFRHHANNEELEYFGYLNQLRNKVAAHSDNNFDIKYLNFDDILDMLDILELCF